jgi:ribosomal-protein-alanine N-acetyltransferase
MSHSSFPALTTERLLLRKLDIKDSEEVLNLRSDESVNAYLDREKALTIQDAKDFIIKIEHTLRDGKGFYWALALKTNNILIGTICYWGMDIEKNTAEIGYELNPKYQGQGLMQEAIEKTIDYGFQVMRLNAIIANPMITNKNSIKLLMRNGFELDARDESGITEDDYAMYVLNNPLANISS